MIEGREIPIKVWWPLGGLTKKTTVADDLSHVGNLVAEGILDKTMYWPTLAKIKGDRAKRAEKKYASLVSEVRLREYQDGWVRRWIEDDLKEAF